MTTLHLSICIPTNGTWEADFGTSLALLMARVSEVKLHPEVNIQKVSVLQTQGSMIATNRYQLVKAALREGATHVLFLDDDMVFPKTTVEELLKWEKPIVAANCTTRSGTIKPTAYGMDGEILQSKGKSGLEEVQHVGMAVMLVQRQVFESLTPPIFMNEWIQEYDAQCGEDVYFCHCAREFANVPVYVDHELSQRIYHIGKKYYGHEDVEDGSHTQ